MGVKFKETIGDGEDNTDPLCITGICNGERHVVSGVGEVQLGHLQHAALMAVVQGRGDGCKSNDLE